MALQWGSDAGHGFFPTDFEHMQYSTRLSLLTTLFRRGVLRDFESNGEPSEAAFRAAANMPLNKNDHDEALLVSALMDSSPDITAAIGAKCLAEGHDPEHPQIDKKFLSAILQELKK